MKLLSVILALMLYGVSYASIISKPIPCPVSSSACVIQSIAWFSQTGAIINTGDYKMWRTLDEGRTFTQIGKNMNMIAQSPANPLQMVLLYTSGTTFAFTVDGGATLINATTPVGRVQINEIQFHPSEAGWFFFVGCLTGTQRRCSLYITQNWGKDWKTVVSNGVSNTVATSQAATWGNTTTDKNLIFILKQDGSFGYTTSDYGNFHDIFSNAVLMYKSRHYMYAMIYENKQTKLMCCSAKHDPSHKSKNAYKLATFPYDAQLTQEDYTFLDDITDAEYMAIHMSSFDQNYGDLFTSGNDGIKFQLSLSSVFRDNYDYDFHRIRGLPGIYVANKISDTSARVPGIKTYITFDNGGEWRGIAPPKTDKSGNPWPCGSPGPYCMLHLHGEGSGGESINIQGVYSHSNAIGVVIANGNVGAALETKDLSQIDTFISRDGGLTWNHIFDGPTVYEFGDHGGIIVLSPLVATNALYYSFDQGSTAFQQSNATFSNMVVNSITTEFNGSGLYFFVQGSSTNDSNYLYTFSLADAGLPICTNKDFEYWWPTDGQSTVGCLLGQTSMYLRRIAASQCYNNRTTDIVVNQTPCPCAYEDYECAPNYQQNARSADGSFTCTKVAKDPPCTKGQKYLEPTGYQLVPGNMCTRDAGVDLLGKQKTCPSSNTGAIIAVVVILFVAVIATAVVLYFKNDKFRDLVHSIGSKRTDGAYKSLTSNDDD